MHASLRREHHGEARQVEPRDVAGGVPGELEVESGDAEHLGDLDAVHDGVLLGNVLHGDVEAAHRLAHQVALGGGGQEHLGGGRGSDGNSEEKV